MGKKEKRNTKHDEISELFFCQKVLVCFLSLSSDFLLVSVVVIQQDRIATTLKKGKSIKKNNNNNNKREEKMTIDCEWRRFSAACRCYPQRIEHIALAFSAPYGPYKDSYKSCGHSGASPQPLIVTENPILYTYLSPRFFLTIDRVTVTW